jgi:septum formation protein
MTFPKIVLASGSPRRRELLEQIGVIFSVLSVDIDESVNPGELASDYVLRLAKEKAQAGWGALSVSEKLPVLGADTSVVVDGGILGKPRDADDARSMLKQLSGRCHQVMTAVAIVSENQVLCELSTSLVYFSELSSDEIDWYIASGEGDDKAGSYAVQGQAAMFIERIEGSYSGIMGLPLRETSKMLQQLSGRIHEQ